MVEKEKIDWDVFATKFVKLVSGNQYTMLLRNWRVEHTDFGGKKETPVPVLAFDVLRLDKQDFSDEPKTFTSGALSFVNEIRPLIERAEECGVKQLRVILKYGNDQQYSVVDMSDEREHAEEKSDA